MTRRLIDAATQRRGSHVRWRRTEPGMLTGTVGVRTVGFVVRVDGCFIAFDAVSTPIGRYPTCRAAKRAALAVESGAELPSSTVRLIRS